MRVEYNDPETQLPFIRVVLSRRNLRALLAKLDIEDSKRALFTTDRHNRLVIVSAEDDDVHYVHREPGPLHPATEAVLKQASQT